ncbi:sigma-54 interaction domain-containing protein [Natranaerobius thermophilus]|uniref:PAS modulated sigma54 specific transcriptional regulator, Fis family n=1 Tax=Natranaerobius thermophilus (strain ATCC BAA-1301 / DSM 18059 / JW/NM-WN-LF) TaxID=457570 RepID=B2A1K8_NATTJ|nr:sigma-54-dependent Fis family transcriptional regulator [Natranaerobius thermophilus]ACB84748.1 PAS modulated sigma54 specific transcriptional regulator, Fis family [Natranaerobius thermophilus JW/NM-WN-LF]
MKAPDVLYKDVLDALDEGVHVVDANGQTIFYNRQMGQLEGMEQEQVIGKPLLEVFPCLNSETSTLLKVLETGLPIKNRVQTYLTITGTQVTTVNSSYPIKINDNIVAACEIAKDITELKNMSEEIIELKQKMISEGTEDLDEEDDEQTAIVGKSRVIRQVLDYTRKIANTPSNVLIYGETGTGKEMFAREIHQKSHRKSNPFIAQNCAALPSELVEGILFGTVKGGFTGAVNRPGLFQQAHKGTLLLDEIHTLPLHLQAKLLRVLEEKKVRPVGGKEEQDVDVRVITTMNTDPIKAMEEETLRPDLYYRISVINLFLPPLRDRKEDILPLIDYFLQKFQKEFNKEIKGMDQNLLEKLQNYYWPGNVRELEHSIEAAMNVIESGERMTVEHLPPLMKQNIFEIDQDWHDDTTINEQELIDFEEGETLPNKMASFERKAIEGQLKKYNGNISQAANSLGISRQALQYKIKKYRLADIAN